MIKKYRKKPIVVEAVRHVPGNEREMYLFLTGNTARDGFSIPTEGDRWHIDLAGHSCKLGDLIISTLEGDMRCGVGDWVIKGIKGEFYPCKDDIFQATYEEVEA